MTTDVQYQPISISLPKDIIGRVDLIAKESYKTRSDIIREALLERVIPTYTPTKCEKQILDKAQRGIERGNTTKWDDFLKEL